MALNIDNGAYTNHNVLGCAKYPIQSGADKASVQAIFRREGSEQRVGHGLRYNDEPDRNAGNRIADQPSQVVVGKPLRKDKDILDISTRGAGGRDQRPQPCPNGWLVFLV